MRVTVDDRVAARKAGGQPPGATREPAALEEAARAPDQLAVAVHLALGPEVADEVPVQRRVVAAAELLERRSEGHVHRAADLLVEEGVRGEAVDLVVEPERDFAEPASA